MIVTDYLQRFVRRVAPKRFYCEDALITTHNHNFVDDAKFKKAYERALKATGGLDYHNKWRVHVALWVAQACARVDSQMSNGYYIEPHRLYAFGFKQRCSRNSRFQIFFA